MGSKPRLFTLEGLRFLATLHLFIFHYGQDFFQGSWAFFKPFISAGYYSTSIFFILSGFILTYVYIGPNKQHLKIKTRHFYLKRLFRLYPFHLLGYVLVILPLILGTSIESVEVFKSTYNLFLVHAWIPITDIILSFNRVSWSASALLFFYLSFPLLIRMIAGLKKTGCLKAAVMFWGITFIISLIPGVLYPGNNDAAYIFHFNPLVRFFEFGIGVFAGKFYILQANRHSKTGMVIFVLLLNIAACALSSSIRHVWVLTGMFSLLQAALIYVVVTDGSICSKFFSHPVMRVLGQSSIAFYFLHGPLFSCFSKLIELLQWWNWFEVSGSPLELYLRFCRYFANSTLTWPEFIIVMVMLLLTSVFFNRVVTFISSFLYRHLVEKDASATGLL